MLDGGYLQYVGLGASHMLTGYDHLLFLFGVVFFLTSFKDVVKFVSVFTLGHCITLIFATFYKITWNYYLIDAVIALSVIYKAFDNNGGFQRVFQMASPNLLAAVFGFGLLHGFGLSTRLQQLPLGDDPWAMLGRILSFNVGVELGQIAALAVMVGVLAAWRHSASFARFSYAANLLLMYLGVGLLLMQLHGYQHDSAPDSSAFPPPSTAMPTRTWTSRTARTRVATNSSDPYIYAHQERFTDEQASDHPRPALRHALGTRRTRRCRWQLPLPRQQARRRIHRAGLRRAAQGRPRQGRQARCRLAGRQARQHRAGGRQEGKEWKVSFKNPAAQDKGKDTLYMFFTPVGNFIAANFSGQ